MPSSSNLLCFRYKSRVSSDCVTGDWREAVRYESAQQVLKCEQLETVLVKFYHNSDLSLPDHSPMLHLELCLLIVSQQFIVLYEKANVAERRRLLAKILTISSVYISRKNFYGHQYYLCEDEVDLELKRK